MSERNKLLKDEFSKYKDLGSNKDVSSKEAITATIKDVSVEFNNARELNVAKQERKMAVAQRLNLLREESGEKQKTVANRIGINVMTLSGYEIGKSEPNFEVLVRLADFYKVSLDYIFCRTDSKTEFNPEEYRARDEERKAMNERLQQLEQELSTIKNAIK